MDCTYNMSILFSPRNKRQLYLDRSLQLLVVSNLITIIWALAEGWSPGMVMLSYLSHSISIGVFWFLKILTLKEFSTKDFTINEKPVDPTFQTKVQVAFFFMVIYGSFHLAYFFVIKSLFPLIKQLSVLPIVVVFFVYQCFSFFYNKKWEAKEKPNIGNLMFFPFIRLVTMHVSIIAGGYVISLIGGMFSLRLFLAIFMLLKTLPIL